MVKSNTSTNFSASKGDSLAFPLASKALISLTGNKLRSILGAWLIACKSTQISLSMSVLVVNLVDLVIYLSGG